MAMRTSGWTKIQGASETLYLAGMLSADRTGNTVGEGDFNPHCPDEMQFLASRLTILI
jgi:hypothetical protein